MAFTAITRRNQVQQTKTSLSVGKNSEDSEREYDEENVFTVNQLETK